MIVSENSLALAALLLAASRIDAWSVVANPRLSERELDQIRDHCGARRVFYTVEVSKEAAAHARAPWRRDPAVRTAGTIAVSPLNEATDAEPVEEDRGRRSRPCSTPRARPASRRA